jgi:hypothetical protein
LLNFNYKFLISFSRLIIWFRPKYRITRFSIISWMCAEYNFLYAIMHYDRFRLFRYFKINLLHPMFVFFWFHMLNQMIHFINSRKLILLILLNLLLKLLTLLCYVQYAICISLFICSVNSALEMANGPGRQRGGAGRNF